jgi:hypothetical protein
MERVLGSHWLWAVIIDCNCNSVSINPIQNPLLLVTEHRTSDNIYIYTHICEWLYTGFGLLIEFIDHLQIVASNYKDIANSHTLQFTTACTKSFQCAAPSSVVVWLLTADVPITLGSWNIPAPQLPASNSNGSQWLNCSYAINTLTHQQTLHFPALHCTNSQAGGHLTPTSYSSGWFQLN